MVATFHTLPTEILIRVLELGPDDFAARRLGLVSQSLVNRTWRAISQHILWDEIELYSVSSVQRLLDSPALGQLRTRVLRVSTDPTKLSGKERSHAPVDGDCLARVLGGLSGITGLVLEEVDGLRVDHLNVASLAGLKHLHIDMTYDKNPSLAVDREIPRNTEPLPFRLSSLTMSGYNDLAPFIIPTFTTSPNLSHLRLAFEDSGPTNALVHSSFPLIASSLRNLSLGFCTTAYLPLLRQCNKITSLSARWEELDLVVPALAPEVRLRHLEVWIRPWYPKANLRL
ncbi:hypothetical protein RQP46_005285 [Phenoliferia psychrophenolica]